MRKKGLLKEKERKMIPWVAKIVLLDNQGIDPGTSCMQSERSTIGANAAEHILGKEIVSGFTVIRWF